MQRIQKYIHYIFPFLFSAFSFPSRGSVVFMFMEMVKAFSSTSPRPSPPGHVQTSPAGAARSFSSLSAPSGPHVIPFILLAFSSVVRESREGDRRAAPLQRLLPPLL